MNKNILNSILLQQDDKPRIISNKTCIKYDKYTNDIIIPTEIINFLRLIRNLYDNFYLVKSYTKYDIFRLFNNCDENNEYDKLLEVNKSIYYNDHRQPIYDNFISKYYSFFKKYNFTKSNNNDKLYIDTLIIYGVNKYYENILEIYINNDRYSLLTIKYINYLIPFLKETQKYYDEYVNENYMNIYSI